jgi:hypothetical protein
MRVLSLGAGVQSSTIALMMVEGEIMPAELAIFADTGAESARTYEWLAWLADRLAAASIPFSKVQQGAGLTACMEQACRDQTNGTGCSNPPLYVAGGGMLKRNCTRDYKMAPILREIQARRGRGRVVQVIGFSVEEVQRVKPPLRQYIVANEYPLIERRLTRQDCKRWLVRHGYQIPPRSSCVYCPYRCDGSWRNLRDSDPAGWAEACRIDEMCRASLPGVRGQRGHAPAQCYVHRSCVPLRDADLTTDIERGQQLLPGAEAFDACTEGMCGV